MQEREATLLNLNGDDIEQAELVCELAVKQPNNNRSARVGVEVRSCCWSEDSAWFAHSCGPKVVKILQWNEAKNCSAAQNDDGIPKESLRDPIWIHTSDLIWSMAFGKKSFSTINRCSPSSPTLGLVLSSGDVVLATGLQNGRIRVWDIRTGVLKFELCDHTAQINDLKFAPDRSLRLASASDDGKIKIWDLEDGGNLCHTLKSQLGLFIGLAWSHNATMLAAVGDYKSVYVYNMKTYELQHRLEGHLHNVCRCQFSPDGAILATASFDTRVILWDPFRGTQIMQLQHVQPPPSLMYAGGANGRYVRCLSFSPNGLHIATVSDDGYMRFWDTSYPDAPVQAARIKNALTCQFSQNGAVLAVGTSKGSVTLWRAPRVVTSLQHLTRLSLRRILSADDVDSLKQIPPALTRFLAYRRNYWSFTEN